MQVPWLNTYERTLSCFSKSAPTGRKSTSVRPRRRCGTTAGRTWRSSDSATRAALLRKRKWKNSTRNKFTIRMCGTSPGSSKFSASPKSTTTACPAVRRTTSARPLSAVLLYLALLSSQVTSPCPRTSRQLAPLVPRCPRQVSLQHRILSCRTPTWGTSPRGCDCLVTKRR